MANGLPMMNGMAAGPPAGNPMGGDEVSQLLALREQIDARLAELMGGQPMSAMEATSPSAAMSPSETMSPSVPMAAPAGLLGGGAY